MKKYFSKALAAIVAAIMLMSMIPTSVFAAITAFTVTATSVNGMPGQSVEVKVDITNNPGFASLLLNVEYDDILTLTNVEFNDAFGGITTTPNTFKSPQTLSYINVTGQTTVNGTFATLTFKISDTAPDKATANVKVTYDPANVFDKDENPLELNTVNGKVTVTHHMPGDVNSDNTVNNKDAIALFRYIAGWENLGIEYLDVLDCNGDSAVDNKDAILLFRYIAGWDVKIVIGNLHTHELEATAAKAATCTEDGNIAYWQCTECGKYYSDEAGKLAVAEDKITIKATGHTVVIIPGKPATYEEDGLTDGKQCSVCQEVIEEQKVIPKLQKDEYAITYHISNNDTYLQSITIENSNPAKYSKEDGLKLANLDVPGYIFEGWYDGAGANGELVKTIPAGTTGNMDLYARWSLYEYTVQFDSPDVPVDPVKYTVNKGVTLRNPSWFGYTFVGWSYNSKIVSIIEPGTATDMTLHANWTSNRNKAESKTNLGEPLIIEDMDNSRYMFVYEIGTIKNVPLKLIRNYNYTEGINITEEISYTKKVDNTIAKNVAAVVSKATTQTSAWTLSEDWNKSTNATNEYEEEKGKTEEKTDSTGAVIGSKYYISNSTGGSTSTSASAGGSSSTSAKVTEGTSTGINGSYTNESETSTSVNLSVNASITAEEHVGTKLAGASVSATVSAGIETDESRTDKESSTISSSRSQEYSNESESTESSTWDMSNTSTSTWNSESGYESSKETSVETSVSSAISELVTNRFGYSSTDSVGGGSSTASTEGSTEEQTNEYSATTEFSTEESEAITETVTYKSEAVGYYRSITVGTVHVFAVVGYDIATNSYYTYTYNVLDKERRTYLDYSKNDSEFKDCENAVLPFEVPYFVNEYINGVIGKSSTLTIDYKTGFVTGYSGNGGNIVIPKYASRANSDGTYTAVRVRGFNSKVFAGNEDITGIVLSQYISEIPAGAFAGCTNLKQIYGYGVTSIGENAFADCSSLKQYSVDKYVRVLGNNAFANLDEANIAATNINVADAAIVCGAKKIVLNIAGMEGSYDNKKISIDNTTESFTLIGNGNGISDLTIDSNAAETIINNVKFVNNTDTPIKINSANVTLNRVTVENAPGFALILLADNTDISLFDNVNLSSSDANAVICKNISLRKSDVTVDSSLNADGNILVCGDEIAGESIYTVANGKVIYINAEQYEAYLTSSKVIFDANGGTLAEGDTDKTVYYGQLYGTLPVPTKDNYRFSGWFTAVEGGTQITADTAVTSLVNQTLYAHWTPNKFTLTYDANGGTVDPVSKTLTFGDCLGELPTPTRDYYTFNGWYTLPVGGVEVAAENIPESATNLTIYAQWTQNALSDWVLASELPEGAEIVESKYSYDLTSYTTSNTDNLSGWTKYNTTSAWSDYGSWSAWSKTAASNSDSRQVETKTVTDKAGYTNYKYYIYRSSDHHTYGTKGYAGVCYEYAEINLNYQLSLVDSANKLYGSYNTGCHSWCTKWFYSGSSWVPAVTHTEYRYRDRSLIYTYYYSKVDAMESAEYPNGENITNIKEWVKYRAK